MVLRRLCVQPAPGATMTPGEIRQATEEKLRRHQQAASLLGNTFPEQRAFILDPAPRKAAVCSRRAGKTVAAAKMLRRAVEGWPNATSLYLSMTRGQAKNIMWHILKNECRGEGFEFGEVDLTVKCPNGHRIICSGADNPGMLERLRGGAYIKAIIDEPGSFNPDYLKYCIEDILTPAMGDYGPEAQLALIGTPNALCTGYFWDITNNDLGWSVHRWTLLQNSMFPYWRGRSDWRALADGYLNGVRAGMNWDDANPVYLREYKGRWVRDEGSLVYRMDRGRNTYEELPGMDYNTIIGVDLGYDDATAFAVLGFSPESPNVYEIDGFEQSGMIPTEVAEKLRDYIIAYKPVAIVCDTGGLAKAIVEEMRRRFALPVKAAEKSKKWDYIELLNDDLRTGKIKVRQDSPLIDEWAVLQWDKDRKKEADGFKNHRSDAFLYAWRECLHWTHKPAAVIPSIHDREAYGDWQAREMERQIVEQCEDAASGSWWQKIVP